MRTTRILGLLGLLALSGCDLFGPDIGPPAELDPGRLPSSMTVGETVPDLAVTVRDSEGRAVEGAVVRWLASAGTPDPARATTDADGRATTSWTLGTTAGEQTLTAETGDVSATFRARVDPGPLAEIVLDPASPRFDALGDTIRLTATGRDRYDNEVPLSGPAWSSSAPAVASVVGGQVVAHAEGTATIRASSGAVSGQVPVVVEQVAVGLGISPAAPVMVIGEDLVLTARAVDARGAPLDMAVTVEWTSGDPSVATVSAAGTLEAVAAGIAEISVTGSGLTGETTADVRVGPRPTITSIQPGVLAPGDTAVITGDAFGATTAGNSVTVGGVPAELLSASATELSVLMPEPGTFPCGPTGEREVVVDVDGLTGRTEHPVAGARQHVLGVGESVALFAGDVACNEIANPGSYVLSVFNASPTYVSETAFLLRGTGGQAATLAARRGVPRMEVRPSLPPAEPDPEAEAHAFILEESRRIAAAYGADRPDGPLGPAPELAAVVVGDIASFRIPDLDTSGSTCTDFITVTARAVYSGDRAVIWEDTVAPLAGTMDDAWEQVGTEYDQVMHPILLDNFGDPLVYQNRLDNDGRIAMLFSEQVNDFQRGVAGFVWSGDFVPRSSCAASDGQEVFYGRVPTSGASGYETAGSVDLWRWQMRATVIHEAKHLTAYATKFALSTGNVLLEDTGLEESTARLAEELYGRALQGYGQGDNVGYDQSIFCERRVGAGWPDCDLVPIIMGKHYSGVNRYFQATSTLSPLGPSAADDASTYYGSGWQLVRWAADHSGRPEADFIRSIIQETSIIGPANLADKVGRPLREIIADYTLAIAVDDHPSGLVPARPELTLPGWDTRDIFSGLHEDYADGDFASTYPTPWPLETMDLVPGDFEVSAPSVAGGGAVVFELNGVTGPQLLEVLSGSGGTAPGTVGMALVRVQ